MRSHRKIFLNISLFLIFIFFITFSFGMIPYTGQLENHLNPPKFYGILTMKAGGTLPTITVPMNTGEPMWMRPFIFTRKAERLIKYP